MDCIAQSGEAAICFHVGQREGAEPFAEALELHNLRRSIAESTGRSTCVSLDCSQRCQSTWVGIFRVTCGEHVLLEGKGGAPLTESEVIARLTTAELGAPPGAVPVSAASPSEVGHAGAVPSARSRCAKQDSRASILEVFRKADASGCGIIRLAALGGVLACLGVRDSAVKATIERFRQAEELRHGTRVGQEDSIEYGVFIDWLFAASEAVPARSRKESTTLGVSVAFLAEGFLAEVSDHFNNTCVNYYRINDELFLGADSRCRKLLCPRDGRMGCSYVDALGCSDTGPSNVMLSWCWLYTAEDVVASISRYCRVSGRDPLKTLVWQCALCNNQVRIKESEHLGGHMQFEDFRALFEHRVTNIGHILALLNPWDEPVYLQRIWCIFELWVATSDKSVSFDIVVPEHEEERFHQELGKNGMVRVWQIFGKVKIQEALATVENDKDNILRAIDGTALSTYGNYNHSRKCAELNFAVVKRLQQWCTNIAAKHAENLVLLGIPSPQLWCNVAHMLMEAAIEVDNGPERDPDGGKGELGETLTDGVDDNDSLSRASKLFKAAKDAHRAAGTRDSASFAILLRRTGFYHYQRGHWEKAKRQYGKAKKIFEDLNCQDADYAFLLSHIGSLKCKEGLIPEAWELLEKAASILRAEDKTQTFDYAKNLGRMAQCLKMQRKLQESMDMFAAAMRTFEAAGATSTPAYAACISKMGQVHQEEGRLDEAINHYERAIDIFESFGVIGTPSYAVVLYKMAECCETKGDDSRAAELCERAAEIFIELGATHRAECQTLLQRPELITSLSSSQSLSRTHTGSFSDSCVPGSW